MDSIDRYAILIVVGVIGLFVLWSGLDFVREMLGYLFGSKKKRD